MMTVYQTPEFDRDSLPVSQFTPAQVEQGRQLFYSKFACQSCHIADYKTDKGYIGPALAGDRQAAQRSLGLSLAERSAGAATRDHGAQPAHDRRRSAFVDCVSDVAQVWRRTGGDEEMKRGLIALCAVTLMLAGCSRKSRQPAPLQATATGTAIVESSGGKQIGYAGMPLDQPVVVQVNDASGNGVAGAAVYFSGPSGVSFAPAVSADRLQRAGHKCRCSRTAARPVQADGQHAGFIRENHRPHD